jgi:putative heme degradation protein
MNHQSRFNGSADLSVLQSNGAGRGLLTEGIFDANIHAEDPGDIRVHLWREWQTMLADLTRVGPVWSIVRNAHATLAVLGDYPELTFAADNQSAVARRFGGSGLACHFRAWQNAEAFDSGCHCGRIYGVEIVDRLGEPLHRICLARDTALARFVQWTQMHQATGLEENEDALPADHGRFHPQSFPRSPGTLEVPLSRLRTVLIQAAQREIPLMAGVANEGITQSARIDVVRASEAQGQLVLSGNSRSLYIDTDPTGSLLAEAVAIEGESIWRLSLVDSDGRRLLHLQPGIDGRAPWHRLIREFVFCSSST